MSEVSCRRELDSRRHCRFVAIAFVLSIGAVWSSAPAEAQFDCVKTWSCYRGLWLQGTGHCNEWPPSLSWCNCDEPGPGQGCVMWNMCFMELSGANEAESRRASTSLPGQRCTLSDLSARPRTVHDGSSVIGIGDGVG
jgi:hypothetical protein